MISTRGRYALRVMLDLAEHSAGEYIPMKIIARRQGLPPKYLEQILPVLTRQRLIEGIQGKGGGYRLCRAPRDCTVGEILRLTEGSLAPVACLAEGAAPCERGSSCRTRPLWARLGQIVGDYLDSVTLEELLTGNLPERT